MKKTPLEKEVQTKLDKDEEELKGLNLDDLYDFTDREKRVEVARDIMLRVLLYSDEMHISAFTHDETRISSINDIIRLLIENPNQLVWIRDDDCGIELWNSQGEYWIDL